VAPIQCQRHHGLHTYHQVRLQQFSKSVLRQSTVTDSIGQLFQTRDADAAKGRLPKDVFILTTFSIWWLPAQQQSVMRYSGARSFRHFCTSIAKVLYRTLQTILSDSDDSCRLQHSHGWRHATVDDQRTYSLAIYLMITSSVPPSRWVGPDTCCVIPNDASRSVSRTVSGSEMSCRWMLRSQPMMTGKCCSANTSNTAVISSKNALVVLRDPGL